MIHLAKGTVFTNVGRVVCSIKQQLWSSAVPRNIADIRFSSHEDLGGSEIAHFQNPSSGVVKQVLEFDISVTNTDAVNICERAEELVSDWCYHSVSLHDCICWTTLQCVNSRLATRREGNIRPT